MIKVQVLAAALILGVFAVAGVGLVALTHDLTAERIAENERLSMLRKLYAIVPAESIDNDLLKDRIEVHNADLLGSDTTDVYRARKNGRPVALVLAPVVPDGYSGPISLLVAVRPDGTLGGVRVIGQKETPGLGDKIEEDKSDWIFGFRGRSLQDPTPERWKVKRDGGDFDQFTGATITPRAVVTAVKDALLFVQQTGDSLYSQTPIAPQGDR